MAFPTDTVWGLGCCPSSKKGVMRIYELKKRDPQKPLILMSSQLDYLLPYVKGLNEEEKRIIGKHFPGALTLITQKSGLTMDYMTSDMDTVGIRIPNHRVFAELAEFASPLHLLATTSANISTQKSPLCKEDVINYFGDEIDFIIDDYGYYAEGLESTIIKYTDGWHVLRQGAVSV